MPLDAADLAWFRRGEVENPTFWRRIGGMPDLAGKAVLDVGCGLGSLCVDMARAGASRVVGIDIDGRAVAFARTYVEERVPDLAPRLELRAMELGALDERGFDIVTSKDSFEHILDLPGVLGEIGARLRPGGRLYAGWGPLYHSPMGDHGRTGALVPWGHVLVPERLLLWRLGVASVQELGLNQLTIGDYRRIFAASGLRVVSLGVNRSDHPVSRLFSLALHLGVLEKYLTHNCYAVLERPADAQQTSQPNGPPAPVSCVAAPGASLSRPTVPTARPPRARP